MKKCGGVKLQAFLTLNYVDVSGQLQDPQLHHRWMSFLYSLGRSPSRPGRGGKEKKSASAGSRVSVVQNIAQSVYWLSYSGSQIPYEWKVAPNCVQGSIPCFGAQQNFHNCVYEGHWGYKPFAAEADLNV
jgi:hypothetical protein